MKATIFVVGLTFALTVNVLTQTYHDDDGPLFLTPYIEQGKLQEARDLSRVHAEEFGIELHSHSFFLTTGPNRNIHIYFWYFEALKNPRHAPFIVWMSGGPGQSSLTGLFGQIGPYYIAENGRVMWRETNWLSKYNLIILDAPSGTGFSFVTSRSALSTTTSEVSAHVLQALDQFFILFPPSAYQDVYFTCEEYAAKHAIGMAHLMTTLRRQHSFSLKGIILSTPLIDPVIQTDPGIQSGPAEYLYQLGVITAAGRNQIKNDLQKFRTLISQSQYVEASRLFSNITYGLEGYIPSFFQRESGICRSGNIMRDKARPELYSFISFIDRTPGLKRALHVDVNATFRRFNSEVRERFIESGEFAKSVITELQVVLDANVKVLLFTGNMGIVFTAVPTSVLAKQLQWKCHNQYVHESNRQIWRVHENDVDSAGYVKCACNFCKGTVRNAGYFAANDEPIRVLDLVDRFIHNRRFGTYVL